MPAPTAQPSRFDDLAGPGLRPAGQVGSTGASP